MSIIFAWLLLVFLGLGIWIALIEISHRMHRSNLCECSHWDEAHEHYRAGTDCSKCGCPSFRPRRK